MIRRRRRKDLSQIRPIQARDLIKPEFQSKLRVLSGQLFGPKVVARPKS